MTATSPLRGPKSKKEAASPPLISRRAAQGTGPPLQPQRCFASRCAGRASGAPLTPGDRCGPWEQEERAGPGLPLCAARGAQNPAVAGHTGYRTPGNS